MSEFNKLKDANAVQARRIEELAAAQTPAPPAPAAPAAPVIPDEVAKRLDGLADATRTVLESVRLGNLPRIKEDFPYARDEDITGNTPDEWRAAAEASHNAVKAIVERAAEEQRQKIRAEMAREYGIPFDSEGGGGSGASGADAELEAAKATGDPLELIKVILGS